MSARAFVPALAGGACLALGLPAISHVTRTDRPSPARVERDADVLRGRWIALSGGRDQAAIACARCHELDGSGNSSGAFPRLSDQSAWYLYKTLQDYAGGLRPNEIMEPIARALGDAEMLAASSYYASIAKAPYPVELQADVNTLQIGGAISARGIPEQGVPACAGCHGENGIGKPPIYPYVAGQFAAYLEHQMLLWKRGERQGDPQSVMEVIAKAMTEDQIRAVSIFFANVRRDEVTPDEPQFRPPQGARRTHPPAARRGETTVGAQP